MNADRSVSSDALHLTTTIPGVLVQGAVTVRGTIRVLRVIPILPAWMRADFVTATQRRSGVLHTSYFILLY